MALQSGASIRLNNKNKDLGDDYDLNYAHQQDQPYMTEYAGRNTDRLGNWGMKYEDNHFQGNLNTGGTNEIKNQPMHV